MGANQCAGCRQPLGIIVTFALPVLKGLDEPGRYRSMTYDTPTVHMAPFGAGVAKDMPSEMIDLFCGRGDQILQWVGYTSCSRLSYMREEVQGRYVPQAVLNRDQQVMDVDLVLNEVFKDGDDVFVEYGNGPSSFRARWDGRPKTPPFRWGQDGDVVPPHDDWLTSLDLVAEGLLPLVEDELVKKDPGHAERDLTKVKSLLMQYAGAIQALFLFFECQGEKPPQLIGRMNLTQFKANMQAARVLKGSLDAGRLDELFSFVATTPQSLERKVDASTLNLIDYMVALVHVAQQRFRADDGLAQLAPFTPLSEKLDSLIKQCLVSHTIPDINKRLERMHQALYPGGELLPGVEMLIRKGSRLIEQTLECCQIRRVKAKELSVDLKSLCVHLQKWGILGRELTLQQLSIAVLFAQHLSSDVEKFELQPHPQTFNYQQFTRLLMGIAQHMYVTQKRTEPIEEFVGETMDTIFKKAGVIISGNDL